jgi:glucose-1-phosphate adenylyltransferase
MNRVLGIILAGGASERLSVLSAERAKPAVPFGGRYRIIDFALSNCASSSIYNVAVLTQYNPRSLAQHIGVGRPWDLDRITGGVVLLQPFLSRSTRNWYKGTADAVYQNLYYVEDQKVDERVISFQEKPKTSKSNLASMGIYVFDKNVLIDCLEGCGQSKGGHDFGYDILPGIIGKHKVYGYRFRGYWRDVGTVESYWQANMDLIADLPDLNLYDPASEVRTVYRGKPPVKVGPAAQIVRSLVSNGAIINGRVEKSVIFPGVFVEDDAVVNDSIIFDDTTVGKGAIVDRAIVDKQVWISPGCNIGYGDDLTPNKEEPENLSAGITVVGKGTRIPDDIKIGRNCKIGCWVHDADFPSKVIPSGESVASKAPRRHPL